MIPQIKDVKKIAVFRALQLGDMLCAVPAFRSLRYAFPNAQIILIGLPWAKAIIERFSEYFDEFISFSGYPGLPEQPFDEEEFESFLQIIRNEKLDLLIQMQGNGTIVNKLLLEFGSSNLAGFYNEQCFTDSPLFMPYPDFGAEKYRHLLLMQHLGIELKGNHLEFPLTNEDRKDHEALLLAVEPKKYVVVHPGSRGTWRQWPPKFFALIADLCKESGFSVIITGTREESDITTEVIKYMHQQPVNLTGKTNLGAMAVLVKDAFAIVSNCTGVSHIADALDTPSVIISMDGEPQRWSPENKDLHRVIDWAKEPSFKKVLDQTENLIESLSRLEN